MKKIVLLTVLLLLTAAQTFAQVGISPKETPVVEPNHSENEIFVVVEEMPVYPGGMQEMILYLQRNLKYPQEEKDAGNTANVIVQFVVEKDGSISSVKILRSGGELFDKEAIRVINSMPAWQPGKQRGKEVRVQYNLPIRFTL